MKEKVKPYIFILPAFLSFVIFAIVPFLYTFYLSFFDWNMIKPKKEFVGLENYFAIFRDPTFYKVLGNTFFYIFILLILNFILPYVLSFILEMVIKKGKGLYRGAFFLPSVVSLVVGSVLYTWMLHPISGPVAQILQKFNISTPNWSVTEGWVIVVLSLITSWKVFGYNFIVILGGISGIDESVMEAAKLEGVSNFRLFFDIVIPMSSATGIYIFIITIVQGLQFVYTPIKVITQGAPDNASSNLIFHSYNEAFTMYKTGSSSAVSMVTMLIFLLLLFIEFKFVEGKVHYEN